MKSSYPLKANQRDLTAEYDEALHALYKSACRLEQEKSRAAQDAVNAALNVHQVTFDNLSKAVKLINLSRPYDPIQIV